MNKQKVPIDWLGIIMLGLIVAGLVGFMALVQLGYAAR